MTALSAPAVDVRRARRHFVALTALRWLPTGFMIPAAVLLLLERGLDLAAVGVIVAVYSVVTATLELPTGGLADVIGRRPVLVASAALTVAGSVVMATGRSAAVLGLAYALLGVARALDSGPLQAWYVDTVHAVDPQADLKAGLSRASAAGALALAVGALAGGGLAATSPFAEQGAALVALSTPFLGAAALAVVHLGFLLAWVREPPRPRRTSTAAVLRDVPPTVRRGLALAVAPGPLRRIVVLSAALGVTLSGIELLSPSSFAALLGGESAAAGPYGVLVTLAFGGTALGSALAPALARRTGGAARAIVVSGLLGAVALAGVAAPTLAVAASAYVLLYLLLGVGSPLIDDLTHAAVTSGERATVLSIRSMLLQLGGAVATVTLGTLADATSLAVALAAVAVALAAGSLALVRLPAARLPPRRADP